MAIKYFKMPTGSVVKVEDGVAYVHRDGDWIQANFLGHYVSGAGGDSADEIDEAEALRLTREVSPAAGLT